MYFLCSALSPKVHASSSVLLVELEFFSPGVTMQLLLWGKIIVACDTVRFSKQAVQVIVSLGIHYVHYYNVLMQ